MKHPNIKQFLIAGFTTLMVFGIASCGGDNPYDRMNAEQQAKIEQNKQYIATQEKTFGKFFKEHEEIMAKIEKAESIKVDIEALKLAKEGWEAEVAELEQEIADLKTEAEQNLANAKNTAADLNQINQQFTARSAEIAEAETDASKVAEQLQLAEARLAETQKEEAILQAKIDEHPDLADIVASLKELKATLTRQIASVDPTVDEFSVTQHDFLHDYQYQYNGREKSTIVKLIRVVKHSTKQVCYIHGAMVCKNFSFFGTEVTDNFESTTAYLQPVFAVIHHRKNYGQSAQFRMEAFDYDLNAHVIFNSIPDNYSITVETFASMDVEAQENLEEMRPTIQPDEPEKVEIVEAEEKVAEPENDATEKTAETADKTTPEATITDNTEVDSNIGMDTVDGESEKQDKKNDPFGFIFALIIAMFALLFFLRI